MFSERKMSIQQMAKKVALCPSAQQTQQSISMSTGIFDIVCNALLHIAAHCQIFDQHVSTDTPFAKEFSKLICDDCFDDDLCYVMLEDLSIFFREKMLKTVYMPLEPPEKVLLDYFETSGDWHYGDGQMVSDWYWLVIPVRIFQPVLNGKDH